MREKKTKTTLQLQEEKYRSLVEMTDMGYVILDSQGHVLDANQIYANLTGRESLEEVIGHSVLEWTAPYDRKRNAEEVRKCIEQGCVHNLQIDYMDHAGKITPVEIHATVLDGEESFSILSLCRDITERRRAEDALRDSESRMRSIVESSPVGMHMYYLEPDGRLVFTGANPAADRILGVDNSIFIGKTIEEAFLPLINTDVPQRYRDVARSGKAWQTESLEYQDNAIKGAFEVHAFRIAPNSMVAAFSDITTRKRAEEQLQKSRRLLETIINAEPECVKLLDKNANLLMMNRAGLDMLQVDSLDQVKGQCICPLITSEYRQPFLDLTAHVFQGGNGTLVFEVIGMKGRRLWLETHAVPLRNDKNEIFALLAVTRDITDRKRAEESLRQSEQFIRNILDTVDEGFIVIDRDYRILIANKAFCSHAGGCSENIIGRHCYEISHRTDRPCFEEGEDCATRHVFETGTPHTALHRHKDANGNILYVETKAYPIKDDSGKVTSVIETINNITEKYLLEEERLKTQKLESIGTLAGGIAHDFNNLLQGVFGYISMAKMTYDQKEKSLAMLDQAEEALHMSVNLTTQLLTFSKGGKPLKKLIRLEPTIENAVKFALSGSHTDYRLDIASDLLSVEADAGQLAQVIQNIVLNAAQAMSGKGTVNVSVKNMDIPSKTDPRLPEGGQFVRIDIEDTGIGISEQNISKIFDPYFTTKQRGSGLGLATSYSIIKNHGGLLEVKSEPNRGSTFTIYLPASKNTEVETATTTSAAVRTKKGRILLMDDEDLVREIARKMVAALGHNVVSAEDGRTTIELFRQAREEGRPFDLVILDLTVKGGMGGEEAIKRIREIDPEVKAVVSSGYADSPIVADYRAYGFSAVLNKPYRLDALRNCLDLFIF